MPLDVVDPPTRSEVAVGRYVLVLGDPTGTAIAPVGSHPEPSPLAQAIVQARREREPLLTGAASLEGAVGDASQVIGKVERAVRLFTEIAQGRLDPASISDEVDALVGLLRRLDRDERWEEALRVARSLAMLLALLGRWVELLQSLRVALSAAEQLGDAGGKAWALHELGTLHLAAAKHAEADDLLSQAHDLRERIGDRRGLAMTNRNLHVLCRALRARLHPPESVLEWILRRPVLALVFGLLLLLMGGAAGAVIRGSSNAGGSTTHRPLVVGIELTPTSPRVTEPVAFHAIVEGGAHPAHYAWRFGDGDGASTANPAHVYRHPGTYTVTVRVSGVRGTATREGTRTVAIHREPASPPNATFSFQPTSPVLGERVSFDATSSFDPDPHASITSYIWKFGDNQTATGPTPTHTYAKPGTYTTELIIADTGGASDGTVRKIVVTSKSKSSSTSTRPSAPTEVTASAGNASATVTWTAPANGGSTITSYTITPYIGSSAQPTTTATGSPLATSTTVSGLANATSYTFTLTATNAVGTGAASEHSNTVTPQETSLK